MPGNQHRSVPLVCCEFHWTTPPDRQGARGFDGKVYRMHGNSVLGVEREGYATFDPRSNLSNILEYQSNFSSSEQWQGQTQLGCDHSTRTSTIEPMRARKLYQRLRINVINKIGASLVCRMPLPVLRSQGWCMEKAAMDMTAMVSRKHAKCPMDTTKSAGMDN